MHKQEIMEQMLVNQNGELMSDDAKAIRWGRLQAVPTCLARETRSSADPSVPWSPSAWGKVEETAEHTWQIRTGHQLCLACGEEQQQHPYCSLIYQVVVQHKALALHYTCLGQPQSKHTCTDVVSAQRPLTWGESVFLAEVLRVELSHELC